MVGSGNPPDGTSQAKIRIDGAHRLGLPPVQAADACPTDPVAVCVAAEVATEQLQVQAGQLARHLQDRRRDVDHREAALNARIAQLENELRISRLWQREQAQEFSRCEGELREQLACYEARVSGLAMAEAALEESRRNAADAARLQQEELDRRERAVLAAQRQIADESQRLLSQREQLAADRKRLEHERSDASWNQARQELAALQQAHRDQFELWQQEHAGLLHMLQQRQQELSGECANFQTQYQRWQQDREHQQQVLERQREQLDQQRATLERGRSEVARIHREALEMRWIAEQLWTQLADRVPPAELAVGTARLRSQLDDAFRFQQQEIEERQAAIAELLTRLDAKRAELLEQRRELTAWFGRRQGELAQQADALSRREEQLQVERDELAARQQRWMSERRQTYQRLQDLERKRPRAA